MAMKLMVSDIDFVKRHWKPAMTELMFWGTEEKLERNSAGTVTAVIENKNTMNC